MPGIIRYSTPPDSSSGHTSIGNEVSIDLARLGLQYLAVLLVMAGAVVVSRMGKKDAWRTVKEAEGPFVPPTTPDRPPEEAPPGSRVAQRPGRSASDDPKRRRRYLIAGVALTPAIWICGVLTHEIASAEASSNEGMWLLVLSIALGFKVATACVALFLINVGLRRHWAWSLLGLLATIANRNFLPVLILLYAIPNPIAAVAGRLRRAIKPPDSPRSPRDAPESVLETAGNDGVKESRATWLRSSVTLAIVAAFSAVTLVGLVAFVYLTRPDDHDPSRSKSGHAAPVREVSGPHESGSRVVLHSGETDSVRAFFSAAEYRRYSEAWAGTPGRPWAISGGSFWVPNGTPAVFLGLADSSTALVGIPDPHLGDSWTANVSLSDIWDMRSAPVRRTATRIAPPRAMTSSTASTAARSSIGVPQWVPTTAPTRTPRHVALSGQPPQTRQKTTTQATPVAHQRQPVPPEDRGDYWMAKDSGLMWQARPAGPFTYSDAEYFCSQSSIGGYTDWRVPDRGELQLVLSIAPATSAAAQTGHAWTTTESMRGRIVVDRRAGAKTTQEHYYSYVVCVRLKE